MDEAKPLSLVPRRRGICRGVPQGNVVFSSHC